MTEIQITLTTRFVERIIFSIIILVLLILLINKFVSDDCACDEITAGDTTTTTQKTSDGEQIGAESQAEAKVEEPKTPPPAPTPPLPAPAPTPPPAPSGPKELKISLGKIDFDVQESGAAKVNNIKISVQNGLSKDLLLFATIYISEAGNPDLDAYNPVWDKAELPMVKAGETKLVTLPPNKKFPPGVKGGDKVIIAADFEDLQGFVTESDQGTQTV